MSGSAKALCLFLAVAMAAFGAIFGHSTWKDMDKINTWKEASGWVTESKEYENLQGDGDSYVYSICTLEYTREDGSQHIATEVKIPRSVNVGSPEDVIYDPDSEEISVGGYPASSEVRDQMNLVIGLFGGAVVFLIILIVGSIRGWVRKKKGIVTEDDDE